jgi:hypothetical protein
MVNALTRIALFGWLAVGAAQATLPLTPTLDEVELDGTKLTQLAFRDGETKVTYQPPRSWEYHGSATQLTLRPPAKTQAEAVIVSVPMAEPIALEGEPLKKLEAQLMAALPGGSQNVTIASEEKSPVIISGKPTVLVFFKYEFGGEAYARSVLLLNRPGEQLRFQLTARQSDFEQLQKAFFGSQFTWQHL